MKNGMRCITLWRPWAGWVARGWKPIETRLHDRFASLVGQRIGIHAGQFFDKDAMAAAMPYMSPEQCSPAEPLVHVGGVILCTALVTEGRWLTEADSKSALIDCKNVRRFGLVFEEVEKLSKPVPARGGQGIWIYGAEPTKQQELL
jgi:hypothetical protein